MAESSSFEALPQSEAAKTKRTFSDVDSDFELPSDDDDLTYYSWDSDGPSHHVSQHSDSWEWGPLINVNDIRVFSIQPARSEDPMHCYFETASLENTCDYAALSYAWGETHVDGSHLTEVIYMDHVPFKVTLTVLRALVRCRDMQADGQLPVSSWWIDAVCINQDDQMERSRQVMNMGRIYERSSRLIAWLGDLDSATARSFASLAHQGEVEGFHDEGFVSPELEQRPYSRKRIEKLGFDFEQRPYFERRWVIQEAVLAQHHWILLGQFLFQAPQLLGMLHGKHNLMLPGWTGMSAKQPSSLLSNLIRYQDKQCSDARDRIYALRSMSVDGQALQIDYTITADSLYVKTAEQWIVNGNVTAVLRCAASRQAQSYGHGRLPSWVPDWRLPAYLGMNLRAMYELGQVCGEAYLSRSTQSTNDTGSASVLRRNENGKRLLDVHGWVVQPCVHSLSNQLPNSKRLRLNPEVSATVEKEKDTRCRYCQLLTSAHHDAVIDDALIPHLIFTSLMVLHESSLVFSARPITEQPGPTSEFTLGYHIGTASVDCLDGQWALSGSNENGWLQLGKPRKITLA